MTQLEILEVLKQQPGILQKDIFVEHPQITKDKSALRGLLTKELATRERVKCSKNYSYKWYITAEGRKTLAEGLIVIQLKR